MLCSVEYTRVRWLMYAIAMLNLDANDTAANLLILSH
jgi:hypothetical protein